MVTAKAQRLEVTAQVVPMFSCAGTPCGRIWRIRANRAQTPTMSDRMPAISAWWNRLSQADRQAARLLARTDDDLPPALFGQLVDADVLIVTHSLRRNVNAGARTFPMPADIRSYVLEATARYNGSSAH